MENQVYIVLGLLLFFTSTLVIFLVLHVRKLSKRVDNLLNSSSNKNIESAIYDFYHEVKEAKVIFNKNDDELNKLIEFSKKFFCKFSLINYNAFGDLGGDMSFVLCLLNKDDNGVLIHSLHSRNGTRVYSKEIKKGLYKGTLSAEEIEALEKATSNLNQK